MRKEKKKRGRKWKEKGLGRRHHVTERMNNLIFHLQIKNLFLNWKSFEASHWCEHQVLLSKGRFGLRLLSIWFLTGNIQFPLKTKGCSCINSNGNLDKALEQTRNKQLFWQSWEIGGNYFKKPHTHKKKKPPQRNPDCFYFLAQPFAVQQKRCQVAQSFLSFSLFCLKTLWPQTLDKKDLSQKKKIP